MTAMKRFLVCLSVLAMAVSLPAQQKAPLSPPEKATAMVDGKTLSITYSSPRVRGREGHIFTKDGLISHNPHYPVWRAGANSATTLETDSDLKIGDVSVPKGKYTLFVDISNPDQWELIVNKKTGEWGLAYDGSQDLGRTKMHMSKPSQTVEDLVWTIKGDGHGKGMITLAWEDHSASVPFKMQ
ncbi:MAG TPA: DUF2911 domain-containing protein [Acidobacteriaceae bacterium]|nr:DUF2911 domain-containing protein [Acidobacteriaceae bacterium]